ncbi:MAG: hypothetical protein Q4B05_01870 [Candidatus Saccharibacteria bacterium]|nr:hypothetical protein [Candidatus Saccharibacteria bacterium]
MTLHFVDDLDTLAIEFARLLANNGHFVMSVPHPYRTMAKTAGYWQVAQYTADVGSFGKPSAMLHRPLTEYIRPFTDHGFVLTALHEPMTPPDLAKKYRQSASKSATPRRLNLCFQLAQSTRSQKP